MFMVWTLVDVSLPAIIIVRWCSFYVRWCKCGQCFEHTEGIKKIELQFGERTERTKVWSDRTTWVHWGGLLCLLSWLLVWQVRTCFLACVLLICTSWESTRTASVVTNRKKQKLVWVAADWTINQSDVWLTANTSTIAPDPSTPIMPLNSFLFMSFKRLLNVCSDHPGVLPD